MNRFKVGDIVICKMISYSRYLTKPVMNGKYLVVALDETRDEWIKTKELFGNHYEGCYFNSKDFILMGDGLDKEIFDIQTMGYRE